MSNIPRNTSSTDPKLLKARVFIGNLATEKVKREDLTGAFEKYGEVIGCSLLRGYGFVQFLSEEDARNAVRGENGKMMQGAIMDVRMAAEGKKSAQEKEEEPPPPRERERESSSRSSSSKSRHRSRSPRRSKWEHPPPAAPQPPPPHAAHPPPHPHDYHPPPHPHDYHPPPHPHDCFPPPHLHNFYPPESYPSEKFPPAHSYPPQQAYDGQYDQYYYEKAPPPPAHLVRHHSPPSPHRPVFPTGEWESRPPPAAAGWEQDEHMIQRRRHSPRPPSPRPQWYRQSPPPSHSDWHRPPSPRQQGPPRSPPRQQGPPRSPPRHQMQGPPRPQAHPRTENAIKFDMEIIVINKQQMDYANMVSRRVQDLGLNVSTKPLAPTASLSELLDNIAKKGLLYAVIITSQHEVHGSLTLTILHGRNPQEHKNMPLEDALGLINRDFSHYCQAIREGHMRQQAKRPNISAAFGGSSSSGGSDLTIEQISSVIDNLQQKKTELLNKQVASLGGGGGSNIQQQQADLQAKILSLLGSNAVMPASTRPPPVPQPSRDYWGPY